MTRYKAPKPVIYRCWFCDAWQIDAMEEIDLRIVEECLDIHAKECFAWFNKIDGARPTSSSTPSAENGSPSVDDPPSSAITA